MKNLILIVAFIFATTIQAQKGDYYLKKGYVAEGYDVTEYFNDKAVKGDTKFTTTHDGVNYKFASQQNLDTFLKNPGKFVPQYGGYCAYAIGVNGKKVAIDPETFEIRDGKLFLFYNSWGVNTLEKWLDEGAPELKQKADINWQQIVAQQ